MIRLLPHTVCKAKAIKYLQRTTLKTVRLPVEDLGAPFIYDSCLNSTPRRPRCCHQPVNGQLCEHNERTFPILTLPDRHLRSRDLHRSRPWNPWYQIAIVNGRMKAASAARYQRVFDKRMYLFTQQKQPPKRGVQPPPSQPEKAAESICGVE